MSILFKCFAQIAFSLQHSLQRSKPYSTKDDPRLLTVFESSPFDGRLVVFVTRKYNPGRRSRLRRTRFINDHTPHTFPVRGWSRRIRRLNVHVGHWGGRLRGIIIRRSFSPIAISRHIVPIRCLSYDRFYLAGTSSAFLDVSPYPVSRETRARRSASVLREILRVILRNESRIIRCSILTRPHEVARDHQILRVLAPRYFAPFVVRRNDGIQNFDSDYVVRRLFLFDVDSSILVRRLNIEAVRVRVGYRNYGLSIPLRGLVYVVVLVILNLPTTDRRRNASSFTSRTRFHRQYVLEHRFVVESIRSRAPFPPPVAFDLARITKDLVDFRRDIIRVFSRTVAFRFISPDRSRVTSVAFRLDCRFGAPLQARQQENPCSEGQYAPN